MSYIGNQVTSVPHIIDTFTGTGAVTTFGPMVRAPAGTAAVAVFVNGVYQVPGTDYTLSGSFITFITAPSFGNTIVVHHLGNGTTTQVPSDGSVTGTKLAVNAIRGNNIVAGQITSNLIAIGAITGNLIGVGAVSGNQIGTGAISANNIVAGQITTNLIATQAVSGNQIGLGAVSANNFAGGGITSNVLASNLTVSVARVNEIINVVTGAIQGNYNVHVSNTSVYYFVANTTGNVTFNLIANDASATGTTGRVNDLIKVGESVSVALMLKQGSTRYRANVYVDGVLQTAYWLANSQPSYETSLNQSIDTYNFIIVKTEQTAHPGAFTVFAANTPYGMANGQGMGVAGGQ